MRHYIKITRRDGRQEVYEGDPAVVGLLYALFGTVYSITHKDIMGGDVTINNEKPVQFEAGLAYSDTTPACNITDYSIGGSLVYTTVPTLEKTDTGAVLKFTMTPGETINFNIVFVYALYGDGKKILIYRGCHSAPISVSAEETLEVRVNFGVS